LPVPSSSYEDKGGHHDSPFAKDVSSRVLDNLNTIPIEEIQATANIEEI